MILALGGIISRCHHLLLILSNLSNNDSMMKHRSTLSFIQPTQSTDDRIHITWNVVGFWCDRDQRCQSQLNLSEKSSLHSASFILSSFSTLLHPQSMLCMMPHGRQCYVMVIT